MANNNDKTRQKAVPRSRINRFSRVARMAGGVAGGMLAEGVRQLSAGNRPAISDLILTPKNAKRVADQLSAMRGAAMKVGQLLSMEADGVLPEELSSLLAQLREDALAMPRDQLEKSLREAYGDNFLANFKNFDYTPLAAASIGQVHRATTLENEPIVLKIQYPGVMQSIDSDVDNIAWLLKVSNLLPKHLEIKDLLEDAKAQLHDEANYFLEGQHLADFYQSLYTDDRYIVPWYYDALSTNNVIAMEYVAGDALEKLTDLPQVEIDTLLSNMFELMFKELFELRLMQTDPNFANYRYQRDTQQIVLLDFGATRSFKADFVVNYKKLIRAVIANDRQALVIAADGLGYSASSASAQYQEFLFDVFNVALEPFAHDRAFDFAKSPISEGLSKMSEQALGFKEFWQTPPTDILYLHRKLGGMFLLATRLKAKVNCYQLVAPWIKRLR